MFREERGAVRRLAKFWLKLGALALGFLLGAQAEAARGKLTPAEEYVRQQAAKGEVADLSRLGEKDEDRAISARFLVDLLTGAYKVHRKGVMIKKAVIAETLDLTLAHVPYTVGLFTCRFKDVLVCEDAVFEQHLNISGSQFEKAANFQRLKVNLNFICTDAIFQGPVNFASANIKGQFIADYAQFQSKDNEVNKADFDGLKVGESAFFEQVIFQGPVDFVSANIKGQFIADYAQFQSKDNQVNKADFDGLKVGESAFFEQAIFQGPVDFGGANIEGQFSAKEAQFQGKGKDNPALFYCMKVRNDAFFDQSIFKGPVDFGSAKIEGQFSANGAQFQGKGKDNQVFFNAMKVGQAAFFDNALFMGRVDFGYADIVSGFEAIGAKFISEQRMRFQGMKIGQHAFFNLAEFYGPVDFSFGNIQALRMPGIILPTQKNAINLEGLIYKSITAGDKDDDWQKLLALVDQARYHAQPYSQLETFLKESGYPDRANEVFIAKKRREMKETWHWWDYWKWPFEKVLLDWAVGYGRHPERAFGLSVLCIILGTMIFYRPGVISRKEKEPDMKIRLSQAFWFSFDAFLPFINLGPDELYKVEQDRRLNLSRFLPQLRAQTYFYLHQLAGYILVTIALAAVTGIIK